MRVANRATVLTLVDVQNKLNPHIEKMNSEGWELLSVTQQEVGIQEVLILFWKKSVDDEPMIGPGSGG
jgi:hypothetical protein